MDQSNNDHERSFANDTMIELHQDTTGSSTITANGLNCCMSTVRVLLINGRNTSMRQLAIAFVLCALAGASAVNAVSAAETATHILIVVGPSNHPPGSHEVAAGGRLIQHCLNDVKNMMDLKADVVYAWPDEENVLDSADTVVFIGDTFPPSKTDSVWIMAVSRPQTPSRSSTAPSNASASRSGGAR